MPMMPSRSTTWLCFLSLLQLHLLIPKCEAFAPLNHQRRASSRLGTPFATPSFVLRSSSGSSVEPDPLDELSDERKANLFQFLLRDLEVEQVPVLGVDATEMHVFQAALWTTMGELSENDVEDKVCLVFESIPVETLKIFVQDFDEIKTESILMDRLPELKRFNVSLVGRGVGPAIVLATSNRTDVEKEAYQSMKRSAPVPDQSRWSAAMQSFVARLAPRADLGSIASRIIGSTDVCDIMSGYWASVCELLSLSEEDRRAAILLSYPPTGVQGADKDLRHDRYASVSLLMNRMVAMFGSEDIANIHLFPFYDRYAIPRQNEKSLMGHLPKSSKDLQNYSRRSPLPGVIIQCGGVPEEFDEQAASYIEQRSKDDLEEAVKMEAEIISAFEYE